MATSDHLTIIETAAVPNQTNKWWARRESNPRPIGYEPTALTPELRAQLNKHPNVQTILLASISYTLTTPTHLESSNRSLQPAPSFHTLPDYPTRCQWAGDDPLMQRYHDEDWGVPIHDDRALFELLTLEGAQAGLSWRTILHRREGYRAAFDNFDIHAVAGYDDSDRERLRGDSRIVRNRAKINAAISNAQATLAIQAEYGTLDSFIWNFVNGKTLQNSFQDLSEVPAQTEESRTMSKTLRSHGFTFVGPTICYAFMQSAGLVNDHVTSCFRYIPLSK